MSPRRGGLTSYAVGVAMGVIVHGFDVSPFSDKVRRALRLKGVDYRWSEILVSKAGGRKDLSPTGKYPVLDHDGRLVRDSSDILTYLDATFPDPSLTPERSRDRALATILEDWADESLYFYDLTMRAWPHNRDWFARDLLHHESGWKKGLLARLLPGALGKVARTQGLGRKDQATVTADLAMLYDALDALLDGDWLAGPRISRADLAVRAMVNVLGRTREGAALVNARPALDAWCRRVDAVAPPEMLSAG